MLSERNGESAREEHCNRVMMVMMVVMVMKSHLARLVNGQFAHVTTV
jgi:hypothetical protein